MKNKKLKITLVSVVLIALIIGALAFSINSSTQAQKLSVEESQTIVNDIIDSMATKEVSKEIAKKTDIKVNSLEYGDEKNIILDCDVESVDVYSKIKPSYDKFLSTDVKKPNSTMYKSVTNFRMEFEKDIVSLIDEADKTTKNIKIELFDTHGGFKIYATDEVINAVYGDLLKIKEDVLNKTSYLDQNGNENKIESTNVNKGFVECFAINYDSLRPDTSNAIGRAWNSFKQDFDKNFIKYDRWKTIFRGLWTTIKLTLFSLLIGIVLGFLVAFVRCTYLKLRKKSFILKLLNAISQIYLTVIRGTPVVVQIMIIYFVIFMPLGVDKFLAAVICFGLNSGAYVAEIVRGGIMSIDDGQQEAGRSLGFSYMQTMFYIVFPQAFKAVLPALANEFVVLLKETSIAFYIGLGDLMYSVNVIRAATYSAFMPLLAAAVIYLVMVLALSKLVGLLERRLRNNER